MSSCLSANLQTSKQYRSSLQWKVVRVEHLQGNAAVLYVNDAHNRRLIEYGIDGKPRKDF